MACWIIVRNGRRARFWSLFGHVNLREAWRLFASSQSQDVFVSCHSGSPSLDVVVTVRLELGPEELNHFGTQRSSHLAEAGATVVRRAGPGRRWRMAQGDVKLIVQGDDFGMCHAVNVGTAQAFREGILTQASTMAACPWFTEAAALARECAIPLGVHQTLTCEWDFLRWRPLTDGPSLVGDDGTFHRTVADAKASVTHDDAVRELSAQVSKFAAEGLTIDYLDVHMGLSAPDAYEQISKATGKPFIYGPEESQRFASIEILSNRDAAVKKTWVLDYIAGLTPGVHLLVTHCAAAHPELAAMHRPGSETYRWAEEYRRSDQEIVLDPDVRHAIESRGIELVPLRDAFTD